MSNHTGINLPDPETRWGDAEQLRFASEMEARFAGRLPDFEAAGWTVLSHSVSSPQYLGVHPTSCYTKLRRNDGVEVFLVTNDRNPKVAVTVALAGFDASPRHHDYQRSSTDSAMRVMAGLRFDPTFVAACIGEAFEVAR